MAATSLALFSLLAIPSTSKAADSFWVVKITEMDKKVEHRIMSAEEYKEMETQIRAEASLFPKAEDLAKKEWKTAEEKNSFPGRLTPRKIEVVERNTVQEKASAKLDKLNASEERKNEPKRTSAKPTEAEKKQADIKAEKERDLEKAHDLVKGKLAELLAAVKDKDAKPKEDEKQ
jgi:hypothetical protein